MAGLFIGQDGCERPASLFLLFDGKASVVYERYCKRYSRTLFGVSVSANSNVNKQLKKGFAGWRK